MAEMRVKTGIPGFDSLVEGGLPGGAVVLVTGAPGTGKSILCMQSLVNGCSEGDACLFVSFEQSEEDVLAQARRFGWLVDDFLSSGRLLVKSIDLLSNVDVIGEIERTVAEKGVSRVVIDSLTALQSHPNILRNVQAIQQMQSFESKEEMWGMLGQETRMRLLIHYLIRRLKKLGCKATFLISDMDEGSPRLSKDGISEFLCDGVIVMNALSVGDRLNRTLEVKKMRATEMNGGINSFEISKQGLVLSSS